MRVCSDCGSEKDDDDFYELRRQCKECILSKRALLIRQRVCRQCGQEKDHVLFPKCRRVCKRCLGEPEPAVLVIEEEEVEAEPEPDVCPVSWMQKLLRESKSRSKLLNKRRFHESDYSFDVDMDHCQALWDSQKGKCALSGMHMTWVANAGRSGRLQNASLDRVDSSKNYSKANTQLVCMAPNIMKSAFSKEELLLFARNIARHNLGNSD